MNTGRLLGVILSALGFISATLAGLWLAVQVGNGSMTAGGALLSAGVAFFPLALLLGGGIYLYARSSAREAQPPPISTMHQQRRMLDLLRERGSAPLSDLATQLEITPETAQSLLMELMRMQVFSGYANWEQNIVSVVDADQLRRMTACVVCSSPLQLTTAGVTRCSHCGTEYSLL